MWRQFVVFSPGEVPDDSLLVSIPTDQGFRILVWYLTRDPAIDRLIAKGKWKTIRVSAPRSSAPARI